MLCPHCNEFIHGDGRQKDDGCLPLEKQSCRIIPCPCCYGWGEHVVDSISSGKKRVCTTCLGRRMVLEHITYTPVVVTVGDAAGEPGDPVADELMEKIVRFDKEYPNKPWTMFMIDILNEWREKRRTK